MASFRDRPYGSFNFLVGLDLFDPESVQGGFMEVSGLGLEVQVIEYRSGNARTNTPIKLTGLTKVPNVTLKRGVIGSLELIEWLREVSRGSQTALRDLTISLLSEDRAGIAQVWRLRNARPVGYAGPRLDAVTDAVAVESLELAVEGLEVE